MDWEWCYFDQRFSDSQCDFVLDYMKNLSVQQGQVGNNMGMGVNDTVRRSKVRFIQKSDINFTWLFDEMWKMAIECNKDHFNFHFTNLDYIQISEYSSEDNGMYNKHHDVFWCNPDHPYHRKLSCTVQLSDPSKYTGGDFVFHDLEKSYPNDNDKLKMKQRGTAIFFPSFIPHAVEPVLTGTRYGLTAWFEGPKWR